MSEYKVTIDEDQLVEALTYKVSDVSPSQIFNASAQDKGDNEAVIELHLNNYPNIKLANLQYAKVASLDSLNNLPNSFKYYYLMLSDLYNVSFPSSFNSSSSLLEVRLHNTGVTGTLPSLAPFTNLEHFSIANNSWGSWITNQSGWNRVLADRHSDTSYSGVTGVASDFAVSSTLTVGRFQMNSINSTGVDKILEAFDNAGASNGLLEVQGGNMGSPSATGLTHKTSLVARGWTVVTN